MSRPDPPIPDSAPDGAIFERRVLDALAHAVVATDTDGIITYMNAAAEELYGYTAGEAIGKRGAELMVPGDAEEEGRAIRFLVAAGEKSGARIRLRRKDGSTFHARLKASPIFDEAGEVEGLVGITWDVTDEVRAEQELFSEKEATEALIDAIPDLIFHLGRDGEYRFVHADNPDLLIRPVDELLGRRIPDVMHSYAADLWMRAIERTLGGESTSRLEYTVETVAGDERTFEGHLAPLRDDSVVAIARDITDLKRVQRSLAAERDRFVDVVRRAPVFMAVLHGPEHVFEFVNDPYYKLVGQRDLIGRTVIDALPEIEGQGFLPLLDRVYETGEPFAGAEIPAMVQTDPGLPPREHVLNLNYIPLRDADGDITGILAHGVDVTEEARARRRLEILNDINRAILNARSTNKTARVVLEHLKDSIPAGRSAVLLFGEDSNDVVLLAEIPSNQADGFSFQSIKHRDDLPDRRSMNDGVARHFRNLADLDEFAVLVRQLLERGLQSLLMLPLHDDRECIGVMLFSAAMPFRDEHLSLADEVASSLAVALRSARMLEQLDRAKERLERLNSRLISAHESERRSLALELHDQVGQVLTSVLLSLHDFDDTAVPAPVLRSLERSRSMVMELAGQIRSLSLDLRPPLLDDFGLRSTLEWYRKKFAEETGIDVRMSTSGMSEELLPEAVRTTAFRVVQEALTNVARHAGVKSAEVDVLRREGLLLLRVRDEGAGFDVDEVRTRHATGGLSGMAERVRLVDGAITVESEAGGGTSIVATIPISS